VIPNAAVLVFPSWIQTGKDAPQGMEVMGQRLIFAIGQLLAFVVSLIPAAGVAVGVFFLVQFLTKSVVLALLAAALVAAVVLAFEVGLGVMLLGWLFERLDLSAEQTA